MRRKTYRQGDAVKKPAAGQKKVASEHSEQSRFVQWVRQTHKVRIFAIPNGGKRGKAEAMRLKVEGVSAGIPDLYIPTWKLWVEMKRAKGGVVSPAQKDWHNYLIDVGDTVIIGNGADDAINKVTLFANKFKISVDN